MSDPKQSASAPPAPKASSTVSYGAGSPAAQRPASAPPPTNTVAAPAGAPAAKAPVSPRSIELVQRSWAQVMPISDAAAGLFYDRLFELDPSVRALFKSDVSQQKKKLMQTLSVAVDGLNNLQRLVPVLEQLGARHAGYMVQDHHYGLVGDALLWTLREGLGDAFNPETEAAWREVYGVISSVMKKAAAAAGKVASPQPAPFRMEPPAPNTSRPPPMPAPAAQPSSPPIPGPAPAAAQRPASAPPPPRAAAAPAGAPAAKAPVSPRSIELVQHSWAQVMPISDAAAGLFYDRLFELDPSVRALFKSDISQQKKKLMQTLSVAVDGLNNLQRLVPVLEQLGVRHAGYMVQDHHYGLVGDALLWTLREGLGDAFNPETEAAWREVYGVVSSVMKKAASSGIASKPPVSPPAPPPSAPPVPEELPLMIAAPPIAAPPIPAQDAGDETMPYHLMAQTRVMGLPPYAQLPGSEELPPEARSPFAPPAPAPAPSPAVSIPLNVPKEVNVNFHLNLKFEADPALAALLQRAPAAEPAPVKAAPPAPSHVAPSHVAPSHVEPPAPSRSAVSPWLLVALCVLVSVSTVFALGPLGQAASSLGLSDLPRLAAPVFTLAALTVGYLWGRGRGSDRQR